MIKDYKGYKITIEKQKPSVTKPETEEEWDKHFETHGGETKGTHKYKRVSLLMKMISNVGGLFR
jgi:hypothetical protein